MRRILFLTAAALASCAASQLAPAQEEKPKRLDTYAQLFSRLGFTPDFSPFTPGGMTNVLLYAAAVIGGYYYARHRTRDIAGLGIVLLSGLALALTALFCLLNVRLVDSPQLIGIALLFDC